MNVSREVATTTAAPLTELTPSSARWGVLGFLCSLSFVLYLDRVCIGKAGVPIQNELGLTNTQFGYALGAFTIAYGLFEVPSGRWGDRFGSRGVLARIVLWWSLFTALTGAVTGLWMLIGVRFLFGAGEAGAYPNVARVVARWFPRHERGTAQGIVVTSAQVGGALAPLAAAYTIEHLSWRWMFFTFSTLGLVWAIAFYCWFRDDPAEFEKVGKGEPIEPPSPPFSHDVESHPPIPWRVILSSANVWLLGIVQICSSFLSYMFMGWYPTYLEKAHGVSPIETGQLASLVLAGAAVGSLASGFINDYLARITNYHPIRFRLYGFAGTALSAAALAVSIQCESPWAAGWWAALSFAAAISQQATFWAITSEIGGANLGVVFGLMNSMGVLGAFGSSVFLGRFADWMQELGYEGRAQWDPAFYVYATILMIGACCWLGVDSGRKVIPSR